jgi:hypothetical protein
MKRKYPLLIWLVEWVEKNEVRLFFSTGRIVDLKLPVKSARHAKIVERGVGLDPGDGMDMSAYELHRRRGKVWVPGIYRTKPKRNVEKVA